MSDLKQEGTRSGRTLFPVPALKQYERSNPIFLDILRHQRRMGTTTVCAMIALDPTQHVNSFFPEVKIYFIFSVA